MKKFLSVISVLLVISLLLPVSAFAAQKKEPLNYVLLGDSIARGAGVLNPDEACYGLMVANTNGYNYVNHGIDGYTSAALLKLLDKEDVKKDVSEADIISISIGGNDFLTANLIALLFADIFTKDYSKYYEIQENFYKNFCGIIEKIKEYNPDSLILMQTIYNMRHDFLRGVNQKGSDLLNECYRRYLDEHPGAYVLVDVAGVLDGRRDCLAIDTIHPNGTGNIEIARVILKALKDEGLGEATEPVILIEPLESSGFGIRYLVRVIKYYVNYIKTH